MSGSFTVTHLTIQLIYVATYLVICLYWDLEMNVILFCTCQKTSGPSACDGKLTSILKKYF